MIITIGRKPFEGTVTDNVKDLHCGAINIDSCRIKFETDGTRKETKRTPRDDDAVWSDKNSGMKKENSLYADADPRGRFPANVLLTQDTSVVLDKQSGVIVSGVVKTSKKGYEGNSNTSFVRGVSNKNNQHGGVGGASRFFKVIK